jgi:aldehyde oxidoreductase
VIVISSFYVNGQLIETTQESKKLLNFLRDDLRLTSAKDGCSAGACGTCTVLVDGKATRACLPTLQKLQGKNVVTAEGLSPREKSVYTYCFAQAGAVQCGFCIPGMVMSAKGLLDTTLEPTRTDVKKALRGNICRCTGYVKIEDAILMAAEFFRENKEVPALDFTGKVGENIFRLDAEEKTLGTGIYVDDMVVEGMLYAKALRTPYPRALFKGISTEKAAAHPDAVRIITAKDVPGAIKVGHLVKDWDALIAVGGITRYVGDTLAIAVTKTKESLDEVLALIEVDCQELTPVTSPQQGLEPDAPLVHSGGNLLKQETLNRGNAEDALARAAHVVSKHYSVPFTEHAFMEPECAIAMPEGEGGILLYSAGQSVYDEQREISGLLALPPEKIHVHSCLVGGGFGGKEDMSVQHHAALAAWLTKKPVKIKFSRQESINIHPKRHAMEMDCTVGCDETGKILGAKFDILSDCGAYASLAGPVLQRACTHAGGPYNFQDFSVIGRTVYTNNPPGGAFRGFGVTQSSFAMECTLNLLAEKVGISPWEIRYRNAIRPGQSLPNGQIADGTTDMVKCLEAVKEVYETAECAGIASSFKNAGLGVGIPDTSRCKVSIESGIAHVRSSAACIGQGMATVILQMFCEASELPPALVLVESPDTVRTPNAGTTTASRQTLVTGEAVTRAGKQVKEQLDSGKTLAELEGQEFYAEYVTDTDPMGSSKPNPVSHVAYGYAAQVVRLDKEGKLIDVTAAYDLGRVVNPKSAEGQIEGGVVMGLGYALTEDYPLVGGYPQAKYGTLGLFRATEAPPIHVVMVPKTQYGEFAQGAKGVGELATVPTAPACQGAYYQLDGVFRTKLPLENTFYKKAKK